jgi:thiamine biosynthesis lipoprotein
MLWRTTLCSFLLLVYGFDKRPAPVRFEFSEAHMGTRFRIVLYAANVQAATIASSAAFERIGQLDAIMSDYRETSELMLLCKQPSGTKVPVSKDLFRVLGAGQELAARSNGAFDVTVGPLVRLWRRARRTGELPDRQRIAEALDSTDYTKLRLDRSTRSVILEKSGMLLDLGGIAKGFAVDEAMKVLKRHRIPRALVAAGGDIVVSAPPPGARGWVIGIAALESTEAPPSRYLLLRDRAVSTSGDAHQYVDIGGVRYSHIVDPHTGLGLTGRSSVTVVANDCTTSDGLATAASVLGPSSGSRLIDLTPSAAALFRHAGEEGIVTVETNRWNELPEPNSAEDRKSHREEAHIPTPRPGR